MASAPSATHVLTRLTEELGQIEAFRALLAHEQAVLQGGDPDQLPELSQQKLDLTEQLASTMSQREHALRHAGFPPGRAGMEAWLATLTPTLRGENQARWEKLLALAEECRNEHALNGKLISIRLAQNQQALTALLSAGGRPLTYGPDGQQRLGTGAGRTLGSA